MSRYRIRVYVTDETSPRQLERKVRWSARREAEPPADLGGGEITISNNVRTADEEGVLAGMYTAIKHAESFGEPLPLDEIDTEVERTILTMKRGQVVRSQQSTAKGTFKKIYDEIMARPRPLG